MTEPTNIADAITAAQGRVANCYTSVNTMGGTLPATQDLTNLPTAIESIPTGGGGGDTIFLPNESGSTISAGDKVLFTLGSIGSSTPTTFSYTSGTFQYPPILVFDNNTAVTSITYTTGALYTKVDNVWSGSANSLYNSWSNKGIYHYLSADVISGITGIPAGLSTSGNGYIYTKNGRIDLGRNGYMGSCDGTHYVFSGFNYANNTINTYDVDTNTLGSVVYSGLPKSCYYGGIFGNNALVAAYVSGMANVYAFSISSGTFTQLNVSTFAGYVLGATGASIGDYVFVYDELSAYKSPSTTPVDCHLFCYQIQSDYSLTLTSVPALALFENTSCYVAYDNRSNLLCIGTGDNAFFYEFDTTNKTFTQINAVLNSLPTQTYGNAYRVMMTPDKDTIFVQGDTNVNIYMLTTTYDRIVPNSAYNYNLLTSYTGIATGNTDSSGNYEVKTVLPSAEDVNVYVNVEPDEIIVEGGAE